MLITRQNLRSFIPYTVPFWIAAAINVAMLIGKNREWTVSVYAVTYFARGLLALFAVVFTVLISRYAARSGNATRVYVRYLFATLFGILLAGPLLMAAIDLTLSDELMGLVTTSVLVSIPLSCIFLLVQMLAMPLSRSQARSEIIMRLLFETLVLGITTWVVYHALYRWTEFTFVPFDLVFLEQRPAQGTLMRTVNDFFEGGYGALIFPNLGVAAFVFLIVHRWFLYGRRWKEIASNP